MTTVVISPSEPFGNTPIQLNLHVVTTLQVGTAEAQRLISQFVETMGLNLVVKSPELMIYEQQVVWRVPLFYSLSDQIVPVGMVEVDAYNGRILDEQTTRIQITQVVKAILPPQTKQEPILYPERTAVPLYLLHEYAIDTGISDLAHQHDHYLYGVEKRDE